MPAQLVNATITFHTNDEDKDHNTHVTVSVMDYDNQTVAYISNDFGHFDDGSTNGPYTLEVLNLATMDLLERGTIRIHINPTGGWGHDTWRFNYILTLSFDDGSSYSTDAYDTELSQNNRDLIEGLKGRVHQITAATHHTLETPPDKLLWTAVFRPSTEGEIQVYGWELAHLRAEYDKLWGEGMRLHILRPYTFEGSVRWIGVWRPSNADEVQVYDWTYQDFRTKYDELWPQGWRVQMLQPYAVNGQVLYAAVWRRSTEDEFQVYGWELAHLRAEYDKLWPQGWRLNLLKPFVINGDVRWTAVWRRGTADEIQVYDWSYQNFRAKYDELWSQGWRLHILEPYVTNNEVLYAAVWRRGNGGEIQYYGWSPDDLRREYDKLWAQGWRVDELVPFVIKG